MRSFTGQSSVAPLAVALLACTVAFPWGEQPGSGAAPRARDSRIAELIEQLGSGNFKTRQAASDSLVELGEPARTRLEQVARSHKDPDVRLRAREILATLDRLRALQKPLEQLREARKRLADLSAQHKMRAEPPPFSADVVRPLVLKHGIIKSDETWAAGKSYRITGSLKVARGATLTLQPGTVVLVESGCDIEVEKEGSLIARSGDPRHPIVLTTVAEWKKEKGHWGQLLVRGRADLQNVQVRHSTGVEFRDREPEESRIKDIGIYFTVGNGLTFVNCSPSKTTGVTVGGASGTGLLFEDDCQRAELSTIRVFECRAGVRCAERARGWLNDVVVCDVKEEGIALAPFSGLVLRNLFIRGSKVGLWGEKHAKGRMRDVVIDQCLERGVYLTKYASWTFWSDLIISECGSRGILVDQSAGLDAEKVTVLGAETGIELTATPTMVKDLVICGCSLHGILIDRSSPRFREVFVLGPTKVGLKVTSGSYPTIKSLLTKNCQQDTVIEEKAKIGAWRREWD